MNNEVLLDNKEILSSELATQIDRFIEYQNTDNTKIIVLSGDETLKAKSCAAFGKKENITVEGYATVDLNIEPYKLLLSDYIIIHTAVIRMAPLSLKNVLNQLKKYNKKVFVILDKWNMLPNTEENIIHAKSAVIKEFSMVNVVDIFNVGDVEKQGFYSLEEIADRIEAIVYSDHELTRKQQIDRVYDYYTSLVDKECLQVKYEASAERNKLERIKNKVRGFYHSNSVKVRNTSSELNLYSQNLYNKWKSISFEECVGNEVFDDKDKAQDIIQKNYMDLLLKDYDEITEVVVQNYNNRLLVLRESILNEMYNIIDVIGELRFINGSDLTRIKSIIDDLEPVDLMIKGLQETISDSTVRLKKRISSIVLSTNNDNDFLWKLIIERMIKTKDADTSNNERLMNYLENEKIEDVKKRCRAMIAETNSALFSEVDSLVVIIKEELEKKTESILEKYYINIEKCLTEFETQIEKEYIEV